MHSQWPDRIRSRRDYLEFLRLDLEAHGADRWRWWHRLYKHELRFQRALRRAEYASTLGRLGRPIYLLARLNLARESQRTGISIWPNCFGPGLRVARHGSVVVNGKTRAGAFCRIHANANIGRFKSKVPVLGDFVYVGPGAVLSGGITLGDRSAVGANSVVLTDVPPDSLAVGAPAVIKPLRDNGAMPRKIAARMDAQRDQLR